MAPFKRQASSQAIPHSFREIAAWILVTSISYIALVLVLGGQYIFVHGLKAGDIANQDFIAREKTLVTDEEKTRQAQEQALQQVMPVMKRSGEKNREIMEHLSENLARVEIAQAGGKPPTTANAQADSNQKLEAAARALASAVPAKDIHSWQDDVKRAVQRFLEKSSLHHHSDRSDWQSIFYEFLPEKYDDNVRRHTAELVALSLKPNVIVDTNATAKRRQDAIERTTPVTKEIETGTLIVSRGDILTESNVKTLNSLGFGEHQDLQNVLAIALSLLAAFFTFGVFLYTFAPQYLFSPSAVGLMSTVCLTTSGIAAFVGREHPQFVPLPAAALVLSLIFGRRVGIVLTLLVLIFLKVGDLLPDQHLAALGLASGMALGTSINKRKELMLTGFLIGFVQAIGYLIAVVMLGFSHEPLALAKNLLLELFGGLSSSIVAIGCLPFLEIIFGIVTPFRIAELTEPDQPLLRELEENAPGTYQHSLAVANLAEAGAKAINGDVNMVRAGAMYHDIGKMVTPRYFIENQLGDSNPHDSIQPEESRAKVLAHVTNGLELAKRYGLPKAVQAFIPEHQGTTIMAYFYHKACLRDGFENVKEADYRYPGPKPQTKESAIVMMADVSEAVTHSLKEPTQEQVEEAISKVFKARWDDGQIAESGMTPEEFDKVRQAFIRVWRTLHHDRLKYPSTTTGKMPVPPDRAASSLPPI